MYLMCLSHSTASSVFSQPVFLFTASLGATEGRPCPYSRDEKTEAERVSTLPMNMMVGGHEPKPGGTKEHERNQNPSGGWAMGQQMPQTSQERLPEPCFCSPVQLF